MIEVRYEVAVNVDPVAWEMNYAPEDIPGDIRNYVSDVITELVAEWLRRTGNSGSVTVVEK